MSGLIDYLAHLGIVRVLSVPVLMGVLVWVLYVLAAPPKENQDEGVG